MQPDFTFPPRPGEQPAVTTGIPHIQLDQTSSDDMLDELSTWAFSLHGIVEQPSRASLPGARALTLSSGIPSRDEGMIVGGEFAHIHPLSSGSGSLHLRLPENHATEVVAKGWGEWHPFALDGRMPNMLMVYAPRTTEDLNIVKTIIEAACAYAMSDAGNG